MVQDSLWYKDAVIYQLHVRSFCDSNADGIGDFVGLTQKLDYLQELGITAIRLLPFYASPLRDDGYDVVDYTSINASYGSLEDFKAFLTAAHDRGIRIIIEMVLNHTSDQHPWFQEARSSRENPKRDWYVWSETDTRYQGTLLLSGLKEHTEKTVLTGRVRLRSLRTGQAEFRERSIGFGSDQKYQVCSVNP